MSVSSDTLDKGALGRQEDNGAKVDAKGRVDRASDSSVMDPKAAVALLFERWGN